MVATKQISTAAETTSRRSIGLTVKEIVPSASLLADYGWSEGKTISGNTVTGPPPVAPAPAVAVKLAAIDGDVEIASG